MCATAMWSPVSHSAAEIARDFAQAWEIPHHTASINELIQHPDVDLVVVAVPHHLHATVVPQDCRGRQSRHLHQTVGPERRRSAPLP